MASRRFVSNGICFGLALISLKLVNLTMLFGARDLACLGG